MPSTWLMMPFHRQARRVGGWCRLAALVVVALVPMIATSCGSQARGPGTTPQATSPAPTTNQAPAGKTARGTGYSVVVPEGWKDAAARAKASGMPNVDLLLAGRTTDAFASNVNVLRVPAQGADLAALVSAGRDQIETDLKGSRLVGEAQKVDVGGTPGLSYEYTHSSNRKPLHAKQVVAVRDGNAYIITFTAHKKSFSSDVPAFNQILSSWSWN
jgi:hypothetical protein